MKNQALNSLALIFISLASISVEPVAAQTVTADDVVCQKCVDQSDLAGGAVGSGNLKNNSVANNKIRDDAVTPEKIADLVRTISLPANSLSRVPNDTIITAHPWGLRWQANFISGAHYTMLKPADYVGGDVTMRLFFVTTTATAGTVEFSVRPASFNSGEGFFDVASVFGPAVNVSGTLGSGTLYEQSIEIPAARLIDDWWTGTIQFNSTASTYEDDVILRAISFDYLAIQ